MFGFHLRLNQLITISIKMLPSLCKTMLFDNIHNDQMEEISLKPGKKTKIKDSLSYP